MNTPNWIQNLKADPLPWLLEPEDAAVRAVTLRDLLDVPADDYERLADEQAAVETGPAADLLREMHPDGYWVVEGPGYLPKYRSTVWSFITLAQLGVKMHWDERIITAGNYILGNALCEGGQFSSSKTPSGTVDCLQGNLCWALQTMDFEDPRMDNAYDWMARTVTGEGIAPLSDKKSVNRYYSGKCGPLFACGANNKLPCAWGAAKVMLAFSCLPVGKRTPVIKEAIQTGVDFLISGGPLAANYPNGWAEKPSGNWWKFGFPVFYITDILQVAQALADLGYGSDPRLAETLAFIRSQQDEQGAWHLNFSYEGKMLVELGAKKEPNKWVTLRALKVLKAAEA